MGEPVSFGALSIKAVTALGPVTIKAVAQEWARRKADHADLDPASLTKEMDEALDVLVRADDTALKAVVTSAKAMASGLPEIFKTPQVRTWLGGGNVREAVKASATALLAHAGAQEARDLALVTDETDEQLSAAKIVAFDYAVAFVTRTVIAKLTPGERLLVQRMDELQTGLDDLRGRAASTASASLSRDLLDEAASSAITRLRQRRHYPECKLAIEAQVLAERLDKGDLAGGSDATRAEGLARCARWLSIGDTKDLASSVLTAARALGATELTDVAAAFIAAQIDFDAGLKALAPIDTDVKRSAALTLVGNARGPAAALDWVAAAGIDLADLDAEGRGALLGYCVRSQQWDQALTRAEALSDADFQAAPQALHFVGIAQAAAAMSAEVREVLLSPPFVLAAEIPLKDDPDALERRATARTFFERAAQSAQALDCSQAARAAQAQALWLSLRDPAQHAAAMERLTALLRDGAPAIVYLPLAFAFDAPVDRARIDQALDRLDALEPGGSLERALARFAMANTAGSAAEALAYFRRHRAGLVEFILPEILASMEIQLLARSGDHAEAQARLEAIEDLTPEQRARLQSEIGEKPDAPSIEALETWYATTPTVFNLRRLLDGQARVGFSDRWFDLAQRLVRETGATVDAEVVVGFLSNAGRTRELALILDDVALLVPSSTILRAAKAWTAYRLGDIAQADTLLSALRQERDDPNDRALQVNILLTAGRWAELPPYIEAQWLARDARGPIELIKLAHLANHIGSLRAPEFAALAAERAPADPEVLVAAYTASSEAGVESSQTAGWVGRAHALSDDSGPVTSGAIEDILAQTKDWDAHVDDIWRQVRAAELPLSIAAPALRRVSLELQLVPMLLNPGELDPRGRAVVPAFSGARATMPDAPEVLALDGSAIVTLGVLGLLDPLLATQTPVFVPLVTLNWLFNERHRLRFHQPSQIHRAEALASDLLASRLFVFTPSAPAPAALVETVGKGLAEMLAATHEGAGQRLVVHGNPVHKIGSFLKEEADLSAYAGRLVSCQRVIDRLVEIGLLTPPEEAQARGYLEAQREVRWPDEPEIVQGATLMLDEVAISYLQTIKVLDRLHLAGLRVEIPGRRRDEASALIQLKRHGATIDAKIEAIRATLAAAIADGRVKLDRETSGEEPLEHPNHAIIKLAHAVDTVVSDERFFNKMTVMVDGEDQARVWCSLDVIDWLHARGDLDFNRYLEARTDLRRAGAIFIPPTPEELIAIVAAAPFRNGEVRETQAMRAFRENLAIAQMRGWLALPQELEFFARLQRAIADAIVAQWTAEGPDDVATARSDWLFGVVDPRNWPQAGSDDAPTPLGVSGQVQLINRLMLVGPPHSVRRKPNGLDSWIQQRLVDPLRERDPDAFRWMVTYLRDLVRESTNQGGDDAA